MPFLSGNHEFDIDRSSCSYSISMALEKAQEKVFKMHACTSASKNTGGREDATSRVESCVQVLKAHIEPCPARLLPLVPPPNYGTVDEGCIYRSAFPQDRNLDFMQMLHVSTILTLVDTPPSEAYALYMKTSGIKHLRIDIAPNKEGKAGTTPESLCQAVLAALDSRNYPLYIHCNQGRHRTGCVVACLRKFQHWPLADILAEYDAYASPKARPGDVALIKSFDPEIVYAYAKAHGLMHCLPLSVGRSDSAANVAGYPEAMSVYNKCGELPIGITGALPTFLQQTSKT